MTQRIFDMKNEQDVKALFKILQDRIEKITREKAEFDGETTLYGLEHLFNIKWGHMVYVDLPVDKSKWIGKLCWLWVKDEKLKVLGELSRIDTGYFYRDFDPMPYANCKPVKRSEIKFVEV